MKEITYIDGIQQALQHLLRSHPEVIVYGQDVGAFGGAFKATAGLQAEFGRKRVFDTPISESAMLGAAIGLASQGFRPIVEVQFLDFITNALHQLLNNAGTLHYRTGCAAPLTVRAPCGGGFGGGPFHSEELEAIFCHMPGIKVVYPAFPSEARSLLCAAVLDDSPVVFLENKYLYRHVKELAAPEIAPIRLGTARVCRPGDDAVIISYGAMVHEAMRAAESVAARGSEVMVVDLRTLKPWDADTVLAAVAVTSRALVVHEAWRNCGLGAEIAATIVERGFHLLDAPVYRVTAPDVPVPFAPALETAYRPNAATIEEALIRLLEY